jgi:hypothetical protein
MFLQTRVLAFASNCWVFFERVIDLADEMLLLMMGRKVR